MDQPKLERLLRLMKMLTANNQYSVEDLAERLNMSVRTVYRYIDTFREAGFVVKKSGEYVRIDRESPYFKDISQLVHFTEEEAYILKSAIESIDENNVLKQNLKKKLYSVYNYKILADIVVKGKNARNVHALIEAVEGKRQVILKNYSSAHSHDIRDRSVEPFAFTTNYVQLWAFDLQDEQNKLFRLSRIAEVEVLKTRYQKEEQHKEGFIDVFRMSDFTQMQVTLRMNLRAATLLTEEYPLAERDLTKISDDEWILKTNVCSYEGVGRFIMGLLEDTEVLEPSGLKMFVADRIKKSQ